MCCHGSSALCVAMGIQLGVLSCCVRHRKGEWSQRKPTRPGWEMGSMSVWEKRVASVFVYCPSMWCHLFPGQAECVWKLLWCSLWLCYGSHIPRARRHGHNDHIHPTPALIINMLCQKWWILRLLEMCCSGKEVVVDAYQCIKISLWWICGVSVRMALQHYCPSNWSNMVATALHTSKMDSHVRWWRQWWWWTWDKEVLSWGCVIPMFVAPLCPMYAIEKIYISCGCGCCYSCRTRCVFGHMCLLRSWGEPIWVCTVRTQGVPLAQKVAKTKK